MNPFSFRYMHTVTYPGTTVTYMYDPMGNRLSMATTAGNTSSTIAYSYDAGDQLLSAGSTTYTYDSNGNRIEKNEPGGTTSYGYDAAGRLADVSLPGSTSLTFAYDGDGNRLSKAVTSGNTTDLTQYVWDVNGGLPQVLMQANATTETGLYTYGLQRISMTDLSGGQIYYQYDGLGSVRDLSDGSGTTVNTYSYDAFGEPDLTTGQVDTDFRFTGEQMDPETGLIYLRARYYDPEIGRFISKDPFTGFDTVPKSLNRYTYVQNNPVLYADPGGKNPALAAVGLGGLYGSCANTGWYIGEMAAIQYQTGHNPFSFATLGGRATGGFAAGSAGTAVLMTTKNPYAAGATAGGLGYTFDRGTQAALSDMGLGSAEPFTPEGLALATGAGTVMGPATNKIVPFPATTEWQRGARADISRTGMAFMTGAYNAGPSVSSYVIHSCQGPPVRLGKSWLALLGMGKE